MTVDAQHPEYKEMIDEWALVRACSKGQREVKKLKTKILPAPGELDGHYDVDRYKPYIQRAIYTNVVGRTKAGLSGAAFRKPPQITLTPTMEYLEDNADGAGQSLIQLAKDVFCNVLETGRDILLCDYPAIEEGLTLEQVGAIDAKATIKRYAAEDLINWNVGFNNGQSKLSLAVLREEYDASEDEFQKAPKYQYRVLRLRTDGYTQQLYRDGKAVEEERYPRQSNGQAFDFIPCFIIGSQNNDPSVDNIPLADIAHVNVGHFRNSADLEESAFIAGQAMLHVDIGETDVESWKALNGDKIEMGSRRAIQTQKGRVDLIQAKELNIYSEMMEKKEGLMLALGAKLVEQRNPNETAAAAKIDATGENSVLADIVTNVEEGIQRSIEWCGLFMGDISGANEFVMNREFFPDAVDPQLIMASIQLMDRAVIAKTDLRLIARKTGLIDEARTDEEIDNDAAVADPIGSFSNGQMGERESE
jgi:hypothetical protein